MAPRPQTSAGGVLALLSEPEPELQQYALEQLNALVPQFWAEISESISQIEALHDSTALTTDLRDLAALVASKVYYYLAEYDEALAFALGAGALFDAERANPSSEEYVETIVSNAIDRYIQLRAAEEAGTSESKVDPRLAIIIEDIFNHCLAEEEHKQALGIALESSRLDIITRVYEQTRDTEILSYVMEAALDSGFTLSFRNKILHHILPLFPPPTPQASHIHSLTRLHATLSLPSLTVPFLKSLIEGSPEQIAIAYQISFDLVEGGTQEYLEAVRSGFPEVAATNGASTETALSPVERIRLILSGDPSILLYSDFLSRSNHASTSILTTTKDSLDARSSIFYSALTFANAFMHAGTNSDEFLRNNLDWLGRASNWSKFTATAALGVIHKGNIHNGTAMLQPYLPQTGTDGIPTAGSSPYSEGGALFALGLIHAARGREVMPMLRATLRDVSGEIVQHGAALGVGVAGMASQDKEAYDDLKQALFTDSAVAGEAAGYALGLVMLGSGSSEAIEEMIAYAHETQHEKIIRGLAVGIAFICYGIQEQADGVIARLLKEKDPILRYGGIYTIALAYAGTADNKAISQLLHIAVSDTSDSVRRAAVTALAFLLFKHPSQVPRIVQLLSESYNPHVRCGATLALGIACAGTGAQDALDLLEPLSKDPIDFVRQGAFIALAMILVQAPSPPDSPAANARALFAKTVADKHEDPMARFGAALAQGLLDAGGRNVTIGLASRAGSSSRMPAVVGMALFAQFWYWFPLAHCVVLAFEPTAIIGVTDNLKTPSFSFLSDAKPSLFAYPTEIKKDEEKPVEKVATAVLSTTAKAKARERAKEKEKAADGDEPMDTDKLATEKPSQDVEMKNADETSPSGEPAKARKVVVPPEPTSETLQNLARVTPSQLRHIIFSPSARFQPVRAVASSAQYTSPKDAPSRTSKKGERYAGGGGVLVLIDTKPGEGEPEWVQSLAEQALAAAPPTATTGTSSGAVPIVEDEEIVEPPPPFDYPFGNDV